MKSIIYETTGRAREYSELACNLFQGCENACVYCYSPLVTHKERTEFTHPQIRVTPIDVLESAKSYKAKGETRRVLFCFTCDPYTAMEQETQSTRKSIVAIHEAGLNVVILTKNGLRAMRDFDLLTPMDAYATTLTCLSVLDSVKWEPNANLPSERVRALMEANRLGIETWVSLEPVLYPDDVLEIVRLLYKIVSHFKIGKLNYAETLPSEFKEKVKDIDWGKFGWDIKELCDKFGANYYFKRDLLKEMGVKPEDFNQTWVCR